MNYFSVAIGGMGGAMTRYWLGSLISAQWVFTMPLAVMLINISGSFFMALILRSKWLEGILGKRVILGLSTGFLGAYTTFSTFSLEVVSLMDKGLTIWALIYIVLSVSGGLGGAWLGAKVAALVNSHQIIDLKTRGEE